MQRDLSEILGSNCPSIRIVDVGAMDLGPGTAPYAPLLSLGEVEVLGFEPNSEECAKLSANCPPGQRYLPYFVGDGTRRTFRFCTWNATSSLYEPNARLIAYFAGLPAVLGVKERIEVDTTRLDDIADLGRVDYLKIDVQGATLDVLRGAPRTLATTLVVQAEVEFVQLYEGQPLFAEVEFEMRKHGFLFHSFTPISRGAFAPLSGLPAGHGQMLWTDAVFVKSFLDFDALEPDQLLRLALILERLYGAADLSLLALRHHDGKTGSRLWPEYVASITS